MKKTFLLILTVAALAITACSKNENASCGQSSNIAQDKTSAIQYFSATAVYDSCTDYWQLINPDNNIWEWRREYLGAFLGDIECELSNNSIDYSYTQTGNNSFTIDYSDGCAVTVYNIQNSGNGVAFSITSNDGGAAECFINCPTVLNLMSIMDSCQTQSKTDNALNGIIPQCVKKFFRGLRKKSLECRNNVIQQAEMCKVCTNCWPLMRDDATGVTCRVDLSKPGDCSCSTYSYYCENH